MEYYPLKGSYNMAETQDVLHQKLKEEIKNELKQEFFKRKWFIKKAILGIAIFIIGFGFGVVAGHVAGHERGFQGRHGKMEGSYPYPYGMKGQGVIIEGKPVNPQTQPPQPVAPNSQSNDATVTPSTTK